MRIKRILLPFILLATVPLSVIANTSPIAAANDRVVITTKIPARIKTLMIHEGNQVMKGQVVARLDGGSIRMQLKEMELKIKLIRNEHNLTETEVDKSLEQYKIAKKRFDYLSKLARHDKTISQKQLDSAREANESAYQRYDMAAARHFAIDAQLEANQAHHDDLQASLNNLDIYAPRNGKVVVKLAKEGDLLPAGGKIAILKFGS
jgi:HlyD family secretion protein